MDSSAPVDWHTASGGPSTGRRQSSGGRGTSATGGSRRPSAGGRPGFTPFPETKSYDKRRWPNDTFVPGMIISASHYEEYINLDPTSPVSPIKANGQPELCPFKDPRGDQVCLKQRIMIVVHAFDDTYIAVPAYSYGGKGLQHMRGPKLAEHLDLHDHRRVPAERVRQNNHPPLLTRQMQPWYDLIVPRSAIHFAYPVSMPYRIKVALLGQLTDESTETLLRFYYQSVPSAFQPARKQRQAQQNTTPVTGSNPAPAPSSRQISPVEFIPAADNSDEVDDADMECP